MLWASLRQFLQVTTTFDSIQKCENLSQNYPHYSLSGAIILKYLIFTWFHFHRLKILELSDYSPTGTPSS